MVTGLNFSLQISGNALYILQQGDNFEIRINNQLFSHLFLQMKNKSEFTYEENNQEEDVRPNKDKAPRPPQQSELRLNQGFGRFEKQLETLKKKEKSKSPLKFEIKKSEMKQSQNDQSQVNKLKAMSTQFKGFNDFGDFSQPKVNNKAAPSNNDFGFGSNMNEDKITQPQ